MSFRQQFYDLLGEIGDGRMMNTAYDTAWAARMYELDKPVGEEALEWLRRHQLSNGSWGALEVQYHHDRFICTLAAATALAKVGLEKDKKRWQRAQLAMSTSVYGLNADPTGKTVGFELIVPPLLAEARALGVIQQQDIKPLRSLPHYRAAKLAALRRSCSGLPMARA